MIWYYVQNGQQMGPVSQADLDQLAASGTISAETYVWREGLSDWVRYGTVTRESVGGAQPV